MEATGSRGVHCTADRWSIGRGFWVAALAAIASGGACAVVYAIASALGTIPDDILLSGPGGEKPLTLGLVVTAATVTATGAAAVFALIVRFSARPIRLFRLVALAVLLASLGGPFTIHGASGAMIATLLAMHFLVAAISVGVLTTLAARR